MLYYLSRAIVANGLKRPTLHRGIAVGRVTLRRWYMRTCGLRKEQPVCRHTAGELLPHLLTLTIQRGIAVVFFFLYLLSPITCIFASEVPSAARTFLSSIYVINQQ